MDEGPPLACFLVNYAGQVVVNRRHGTLREDSHLGRRVHARGLGARRCVRSHIIVLHCRHGGFDFGRRSAALLLVRGCELSSLVLRWHLLQLDGRRVRIGAMLSMRLLVVVLGSLTRVIHHY